MNSIEINMGYLFEQQNWDEVIFVVIQWKEMAGQPNMNFCD